MLLSYPKFLSTLKLPMNVDSNSRNPMNNSTSFNAKIIKYISVKVMFADDKIHTINNSIMYNAENFKNKNELIV